MVVNTLDSGVRIAVKLIVRSMHDNSLCQVTIAKIMIQHWTFTVVVDVDDRFAF